MMAFVLRTSLAVFAAAALAAAAQAPEFKINGITYVKTEDGRMVPKDSMRAALPTVPPAEAAKKGPALPGAVNYQQSSGQEYLGKRYALVIGNTSYEPPLEQLVNPKKDSRDMCDALKRMRFEVSCHENIKSRRDFVEKVDAFADKLRRGSRDGAVGLFYFAGHGVQLQGANYLLPTTAQIKRDRDLEYESMSLKYVMDAFGEAGNPFNIVILDACRNNPLQSLRRTATDRLPAMEPSKVSGGSFIAFATAEGNLSYDGPLNGNGIFTKHILLNLERPGQRLEDVFKRVTQGVQDETYAMERGPQIPWISASYRGEFCFNGCADAGASDYIAKLKIEREAEVERLQLEKDLIRKQLELEKFEASKRGEKATREMAQELDRIKGEKRALDEEKKRLEASIAALRDTQKAAPARPALNREEQQQADQLRREMEQLKRQRSDAEQEARTELAKLQAEKTRMESERKQMQSDRQQMEAEMKAQQERLKNVKDETRTEETKKKPTFIPPSF
jgi:hypothetical protein